jgi:hypothetical protein
MGNQRGTEKKRKEKKRKEKGGNWLERKTNETAPTKEG